MSSFDGAGSDKTWCCGFHGVCGTCKLGCCAAAVFWLQCVLDVQTTSARRSMWQQDLVVERTILHDTICCALLPVTKQ